MLKAKVKCNENTQSARKTAKNGTAYFRENTSYTFLKYCLVSAFVSDFFIATDLDLAALQVQGLLQEQQMVTVILGFSLV